MLLVHTVACLDVPNPTVDSKCNDGQKEELPKTCSFLSIIFANKVEVFSCCTDQITWVDTQCQDWEQQSFQKPSACLQLAYFCFALLSHDDSSPKILYYKLYNSSIVMSSINFCSFLYLSARNYIYLYTNTDKNYKIYLLIFQLATMHHVLWLDYSFFRYYNNYIK